MTLSTGAVHIAIIGAGLSGSACAAGLQQAGAQVTVFDKAQTVGGHTATRPAAWVDASGADHSITFDDRAQYFTSVSRRFKVVATHAMAASQVSAWRPRVHTVWPSEGGQALIATPAMPSLCKQLLTGSTVHLNRLVRRLQRTADGRWYVVSEGSPLSGPFHSVVIALPPAQAAVLLAGHEDQWANALLAKSIEPHWTLNAVTDDVDWPWDAAQPDRGPLAWVLRNDRVPGSTVPPGFAVWTAHATTEWSVAHLHDDPQALTEELQLALRAQLPIQISGTRSTHLHYFNAYRGRSSGSNVDRFCSGGTNEVWWNESLALGVCGNLLEDGGLEAAWHSGDELSECMSASFDRTEVAAHDSASLSTLTRTVSDIHSPLRNPPAVIHQATRIVASPIQSAVGQSSNAGLKVSRPISFSNR